MKALLPILAAACLLAAGCTAPGSSDPGAGLRDLRVCGADGFDLGESRCGADERGAPLASGRFYCSARLDGDHEGETFRGRFFYDGRPFPESRRTLPANTGSVSINVYTGGKRLPHGRWGCELRVGDERVRTTFASGGPAGRIVDVAACPTSATTQPASVCSPTWTRKTIPATGSVTCSATFAGALGRVGRVDLHVKGKPSDVHFARKLPLPVSAFSVKISAPKGNLGAGLYACVYSLDGEKLATKRFTIASA